MKTILTQSLIIAFCLWHMAAIAAYAMPGTLRDEPIFKEFYSFTHKKTKAYVQITSQWQNWPLFAPNPLRRVVEFAIEAKLDGTWKEMKRVSPETVKWWNSSSELKTIRRLEKKDHYAPIRESYTQEVCRTKSLPPDTPIRLRVDYFVVPRFKTVQTAAEWRAWEPKWKTRIDHTTACP